MVASKTTSPKALSVRGRAVCFALGTLCQQPLAAVCHKGSGCTHSYGGPARTRIPRCLQPTVFGARQHRFALRRLWFDLWRQYVSSRPDPSSKIVKPGRVTTAHRPQCWQRPGKTRVQFRMGAHANTCSGWYRVPDNISVVSAGICHRVYLGLLRLQPINSQFPNAVRSATQSRRKGYLALVRRRG